MVKSNTHILKFGGSSLKNAALIEQAVNIVVEKAKTVNPTIVVSAINGTTDTLIKIAHQPKDTTRLIDELESRHLKLLTRYLSRSSKQHEALQDLFIELRTIAETNENAIGRAQRDRILSIGERASALIFTAALTQKHLSAKAIEAHEFIKTNAVFGEAAVKLGQTRQLVQKKLTDLIEIPVITGFIGSDDEGRITTLGRSGSDYTAGLLADALNADHLEIWTDVNGVLTADPKQVPTARHIETLSFDDIEELSAHGANVIHPKTIRPIRKKKTSVRVKNSYNPGHPGTYISGDITTNGSLKTITITGPFAWLSLDARHAYSLLAKLRNWADTNDQFSFTRKSDHEPVRILIDQPFFNSIEPRLIEWASENGLVVNPKTNIYNVKKFSNSFTGGEQLTSRIWNILADNKLQPLHIERNQDERFISFLFEKDEAIHAARLLDNYLKNDKKIVDLFIAGTGAIGSTLLKQLRKIETDGIEFRLLGACNSRFSVWNNQGISLEHKIDWSKSSPTNWEKNIEKLTRKFHHNLIFIDATGSAEIARLYPKLFKNNIHIVTPSKLANTFEQSFFDTLQKTILNNNTSFRYETTVGAGLPVVSTINDLRESGDDIFKVSGVVSGTMTYIFNQVENGVSFSDAVAKARELGYAEPDPRDDLSGEDVARKFLTIARTMGLKIERDEIDIESLIPEELVNIDRSTFLNRLQEYDSFWETRFEEANDQNKTLRYVGKLENGKITIGIEELPVDSPIGQLKGTDNLIQISSSFYNQTPLIIQGPGAGKDVTAAGVMADVLKTANAMR